MYSINSIESLAHGDQLLQLFELLLCAQTQQFSQCHYSSFGADTGEGVLVDAKMAPNSNFSRFFENLKTNPKEFISAHHPDE